MEVIKYPSREEWASLAQRPALDVTTLFDTVRTVLDEVRKGGDAAVIRYEEKFDKIDPATFKRLQVSEQELAEAKELVPEELKQAIRQAKNNIEIFHASQRFTGKKVETTPGVTCWQKAVAIEKVGLYIPGGTAPLFSTVLMLAVPARIAGCKEIVLCTPPGRDGKVHPAILFAAETAGVSKIFKAGGIQAIAAMAYGTESVPKVYKIFGPGNQYVTAAKQLVSLKEVAIDMPAGPSEVEVIADESANPAFIAADFLSQAEHGVDSQAMLVTASESIVEPVMQAIREQLDRLPRKEITEKSLSHSRLIVLKDKQEVIDFTNLYAPEHLIIQTTDYADIAGQVENAGSVFMGPYTPESAGDYASGTNHTLPTNGYAKVYSGVNLDSFIKKITFQEIIKNWETFRFYTESMERFRHLFRFNPQRLVCDLHPDYLSSQEAERISKSLSLPLLKVQHHHAHAAACMLEHGLNEPVLAIVMDGTGLGDDGKVWGGEFFFCDRAKYRRLSHFEYVPLPGGDKAAEEPWRMVVAYLWHYFKDEPSGIPYPADFVERIGTERITMLERMMEKGVNTPYTSSAGRLFDAVASLLGICDVSSHQAEAPVLLEQAAMGERNAYAYPVSAEGEEISFYSLFEALLHDKTNEVPVSLISARFHTTLASLFVQKARLLIKRTKATQVVISGGCFQNKLLTESMRRQFIMAGVPVYIPSRIPCNDGGIAVGQLTIASVTPF